MNYKKTDYITNAVFLNHDTLTMDNRLAHVLIDSAMDFCPSYKVYRDLYADKVIPPKEREFLKKVYPLDMSRQTGRKVMFHGPTMQQLKTLLKDECVGQTLVGNDAKRGQAKELLAKCLNVVNKNNQPYTAADDMAQDQALRIGLDRDEGILLVNLGPTAVCIICWIEGPMEGFFYFKPSDMNF